jgi:hypothetical protein
LPTLLQGLGLAVIPPFEGIPVLVAAVFVFTVGEMLITVKVELLWWEGCPSTPEARGLLEDVLAGRAEIEMREVHTDEEAEALAFPGSPTIRIDGRDVDPRGAARPPSLTCRIYYLPDGRVSPVPTREQLEEALT